LRNVWGSLYSNDAGVVDLIAQVLPFAAAVTVSVCCLFHHASLLQVLLRFSHPCTLIVPASVGPQIFDGTQSVCGGVLRGAGKQSAGAAINLFAFYCVGLPISLVLGFASPFAFFGIWCGSACSHTRARALGKP
jgi:MATE family multidrug resistance protein